MVSEIANRANSASLILAHLSTEIKNQTLGEMANALEENCTSILSANEKDYYLIQIKMKLIGNLIKIF